MPDPTKRPPEPSTDRAVDRSELGAASDELQAGFDPLIVNPIIATGETGAIERPGDDRPAWVIGIFFAAFCALISGLVTVALTRDDVDDNASLALQEPTAGQVIDSAGADIVPSNPSPDSDVPPVESPSEVPNDAGAAAESTPIAEAPEVIDDPRLPNVGEASINGVGFDIAAGCATHLPLAPNDADAQVSSYFFRDSNDDQRVIDRRFGTRDDAAAAQLLGDSGDVLEVEDLGGSGAFVALFEGADGAPLEVAVNPGPDDGTDCADSLVTNEPGQFAFPYTRIVMFVCTDGTQGSDLYAAGTTSEGGRFSARENGDDTVTVTYRDPDLEPDFVDRAAFGFERDGRLGYSGVVTNGSGSLDITLDFAVDRAVPCTSADLV